MRIFFVIIMLIGLCSFLHGDQTFFKNNMDIYNIVFDKSDFGYLFEHSSFLVIDSVLSINEKEDSLYAFFKNSNEIYYCKKNNNEYHVFYVQKDEYEKCYCFINYDVNNDSTKEIVTFYTLEGKGLISVFKYDKNLCTLQKLLQHEYFLYMYLENLLTDVKIRNDKIYFIYSPCSIVNEKFFLKVGIIDYTNDLSKEIYFKPISIISEEEWNRL